MFEPPELEMTEEGVRVVEAGSGPIRGQYPGHLIPPDQSEDANTRAEVHQVELLSLPDTKTKTKEIYKVRQHLDPDTNM